MNRDTPPAFHSGYAPSYAPPQGPPPNGYVVARLFLKVIDHLLSTGSQAQASRDNTLHQALIIRSRPQASRHRIKAIHLPPGRHRASILLLLARRPINISHLPVLLGKINGARLLALLRSHLSGMAILDKKGNRHSIPLTRTVAVARVQT